MITCSCCERRSGFGGPRCGCSPDRYCRRCILCEAHCACGAGREIVVIDEGVDEADTPRVVPAERGGQAVWSSEQIVVVEDEGTERAMTMLEALLRLPTEARGGRPERCEAPPKPKVRVRLIPGGVGAIVEELVEEDGDVPEFVPQEIDRP